MTTYDSWKATHLADWRDDPADDDYPDHEESPMSRMTYADMFEAVRNDLPPDVVFTVKVETYRHTCSTARVATLWEIYVQQPARGEFYSGPTPEEAVKRFLVREQETPTLEESVELASDRVNPDAILDESLDAL